jgi:hypothetical protein
LILKRMLLFWQRYLASKQIGLDPFWWRMKVRHFQEKGAVSKADGLR